MLESLVAWVLNNYLGKYVENLNTDQLSIALLQGAVELENLPLRKDALRQVGLPIQVRAGFIGKVRLQIPVRQIRSAPWEISIEQLYLVAGPVRLSEWDEDAEEQAAQDYKHSLLDALEARWRAETEAGDVSYYASSYSSWLSYGTTLVTNIVENLQLKIKDVHLRYEDDLTVNGSVFAAGVRIESLTAQSCDDTWSPKYMCWDSVGYSYKVVQLSSLAVYWDNNITKDSMWGDLALGELAVAMSGCFSESKQYKHDFLLSPVSAACHIKRNRSEHALRSRNHPRIVCDLHLEEVPLTLSEKQYGQMVGCIKGLSSIQKSQRYRKHRPLCTIKENPRLWWQFAITCVSVPRPTWASMLQRAKDNVAYVDIYSRLLSTNTASAPLPPESKELKDAVEWERGFEELSSLREIAMHRVRPAPVQVVNDEGSRSQGRSILVSWFPQWWGWHSSPQQNGTSADGSTNDNDSTAVSASTTCSMVTETATKLSLTNQHSSELEGEILDALADTAENNTILRRDTVFGQFNFSLKKGSIELCETTGSEKRCVMDLQFEDVQLGFESRPRTGSLCFHVTLGAVSLHDHFTVNSAFPVLISPQSSESAPSGRPNRNLPPGLAKLLLQDLPGSVQQPLFHLLYEFKPFNSAYDYRLQIRSESIDVVYNPGATKWIIDFFTIPHQTVDPNFKSAARQSYHAMKQRTKQELLRNWDNILQGHLNARQTWDVDLDISAPQIFLVEHFTDKNAILCMVDFGKLHFSNQDQDIINKKLTTETISEDDDDEAFQTPCSTPPGSEASLSVGSPLSPIIDVNSSFSESALQYRLYDRYQVELNDLQILVGYVKDNWKFAHVKGTSTLHVLDRFNIILQVERRVVYTTDPLFPSLKISGNLPKLILHVNEPKIQALRTLFSVLTGKGLVSPFKSYEQNNVEEKFNQFNDQSEADMNSEHTDVVSAKLLMLQFSVDQMALEVQSRGRSVAELQVAGVRVSFMKRPYDINLTLTVHSLLLVDALQTFGPDFELLVASHKHVGMDSVSGSLRDSEPTSPTSPGSPDPLGPRSMQWGNTSNTSPVALTKALSTLSLDQHRAKSPVGFPSSPQCTQSRNASTILKPDIDSEALITVELVIVSAQCPGNDNPKEDLQIANIQFNNLDIIANQETIVELIGFVKRVFPQQHKLSTRTAPSPLPTDEIDSGESRRGSQCPSPPSVICNQHTKLLFDFHRLNILLLRAVIKDNTVIGRKIATATMTDAKIHADIGNEIIVEGSLGGLQMLDLTPEGGLHHRILSLGQDPLTESPPDLLTCLSADLYRQGSKTSFSEKQAFSFSIKRSLSQNSGCAEAEISLEMASVWYTHSPQLLYELQSCAADFKQYLAHLARSIGSAATEMAIGLVHARAETLVHSLSMGNRFYGSAGDVTSTPRKYRRSFSYSTEQLDSSAGPSRGTITPFSPNDDYETRTRIKWKVNLETPVVVLPRSANNTEVLVAHLGHISLSNNFTNCTSPVWGDDNDLAENYNIEIKDMNLFTLNIQHRISQLSSDGPLMRVEKLYSCREDAKPILHDTTIHLNVERDTGQVRMKQTEDILLEPNYSEFFQAEKQDVLQINGSIITPIKVSLSKEQYEQVIETFLAINSVQTGILAGPQQRTLMDIVEEEAELHTGVSALNLDPTLRARMLIHSTNNQNNVSEHNLALKVSFELPLLTMELIADFGSGEQGLVDLSFKELVVQYDQSQMSEINIQMSLRSLLLEDLLKPPDSKHRCIMTSVSNSAGSGPGISAPIPNFVSKSCPNLSNNLNQTVFIDMHNSLPDHLEAETVLGAPSHKPKHIPLYNKGNSLTKSLKRTNEEYPCTPPPSPRTHTSPRLYHEDNLVHINVILRKPRHHSHNMTRTVMIDFNSLDMVFNVESWVVVLDFFGISSSNQGSVSMVNGSAGISNDKTTSNDLKETTKYHDTTGTDQSAMNSEFDISVKSLTVILNQSEHEVARANMSHLNATVSSVAGSGVTDVRANVGSFSLLDLTPVHSQYYRERFITAGLTMLLTKYQQSDKSSRAAREFDIKLDLDMSSVLYVHTQRFVAELQAFFTHFSHLQQLLESIRSSTNMPEDTGPSYRVKLDLHAASPVIFLPQSSRSTKVLVADLGKLTVSNQFKKAGSEGTISISNDPDSDVLLDVMQIQLENMDLFTGEWSLETGQLCMGSYWIQTNDSSMLREKCQLQLQVERNLMSRFTHCVPDMSIKGTLSTLAATLNVDEYKLCKGVLAFNIGECVDDLQPNNNSNIKNGDDDEEAPQQSVWPCTSLYLELLDVSVRLQPSPDVTLTCINFIKSYLNVDSYSDRTQDVDLVSREILITDTRFQDEPVNKRSNVFTNILQPMQTLSTTQYVQAQIHHRRRADLSKFTILLNNMRLMAILDWWELFWDFLMENPENPPNVINPVTVSHLPSQCADVVPFEMKLNVTDSEVVVVEDTSQWDTNAVILRSTTVITYHPLETEKPVSCSLNHCEMFSCILGMEDETALSIIDPVTINIEIVNKHSMSEGDFKVLKVQMVHLSLRLSYHDVRMFSQMLQSLPQQTRWARKNTNSIANKPANFLSQVKKLTALGFTVEDCSEALERCNGQLDDAALWLTQHALSTSSHYSSYNSSPVHLQQQSPFSFTSIEVKTDCLSVCIIDDCKDADVPLLELSMINLTYKHDMIKCAGSANCQLASDYYNRILSGWEPFLEPWRCEVIWEKGWNTCNNVSTNSSVVNNTNNQLQVHTVSQDLLNINITSTVIDLFRLVKENWTDDYYNLKERTESHGGKNVASPPGYRRRSPFVPFALHNDTGSRIWFTTITTSDESVKFYQDMSIPTKNSTWQLVEPGDTVPFSFEERGKQRHRNTHKLKTHKVSLCVDGWRPIQPVSVDRVGVYFRQASPDFKSANVDLPPARVVLEVMLEGSARKLVTVRSALQVTNSLTDSLELKLDNTELQSGPPLHLIVDPGTTLSIPLAYAMSQIFVRPLEKSVQPSHYHAFCSRPLSWKHVSQPGGIRQEMRQCHSNRGLNYRFCVITKRENYPYDRPPPVAPPLHNVWVQPAHTIKLISPLTLVNLLPHELYYRVRDIVRGRIGPGQQTAVQQVDTEEPVEILFHIDNFPGLGSLLLPGRSTNFTTRLRLQDQSGRRLHLQAAVTNSTSHGLKISVSAPYWFVNKTALPLVFRQEGVATETAGQYEEHELARMVAPLLFSFSDQDASPTVVARIGNRAHPEGIPQWCHHFQLHPGIQVRRLRISLRDNRPDLIYMIGIEVRPGRGQFRCTNIVTLSAHYQIHNKSTYRIQFAQQCFASTVTDPGAQSTFLQAVPECFLAFHWPRLDKDQLLCLRLMDVPQCCWSGGFKINANDSFHINVRDQSGKMYFLRVEIVLQGATYFIVLTDAGSMPAPIRIDNFSHVPLQFYQGRMNHVSNVRARSSVPYAWDEPTQPPILTLVAPGGVSAKYDLNTLGEGPGLTYENFIYIAFSGTFKGMGDVVDPLDVSCQQLVLDVPEGSDRVILSRKQQGARSQLWRMTGEGQLQHEGSSPPCAPSDRIMVLDISGPAPQPSQYVGLSLHRPDKRRTSTQTWRFTDDGRLCCAHNNMCVQAKDGFFGLRKGSEAVLGPPQPVCYRTTEQGLPLEQAVSRQRLRPGSGYLSVKVDTDGPTRVIQIHDIKEKRTYAMVEERDWVSIVANQRPSDNVLTDESSNSVTSDVSELQLSVNLPSGIGVSLISRHPPEELVFIQLTGIQLSSLWTNTANMFDMSVRDIQVDNQLFEAQYPVLLYVTPSSRSTDPEETARPAIQITAERVPQTKDSNAEIFKHLVLRVKSLSLNVEERLALKLFEFAGYAAQEEKEDVNESDFETQRMLAEVTSTNAKRYYFRCLKLIFSQVRLSVMTSNKLGERLTEIKRKLGLTLIKFEDAAVELEPYSKLHIFETGQFLINSILKHYKDELKWQAAKILGSVDFLGNPLGFVNDLSEGMSGLIYEGNVGALVRNVTHGLSNSAAKVAETLGDGIGQVILDDRHEETRQRIRRVHNGSSGDHLVAGLKGFGFGILGGVTSVFKQTYEGAASEGLPGFVSGLGKGLVGTVTKPVVGVLDLATETASAVRDSSRSSSRISPGRKRLPRCVTSPNGLLPLYNYKQSHGQQFLYLINKRNYDERFMAYEVLRSGKEDLRIVISNEMIRVFTSSVNCSVVIEAQLSDLCHCQTFSIQERGDETLYYIELAIKGDMISSSFIGTDPVKRPRVRCDNESVAKWVAQQVNHAKSMYIEQQQTLLNSTENLYED
ncbi:vacuolar protein sorting 13D [Lycorma delicatula]|uniref:vacuolar protein sorting 13D n=1 Tax=Lycorma delicatula TaxID=130591 RepID=UPI003F519A20